MSGLARLPGGRLEPLAASSRGAGEVMAAALADGCTRIVLGIGGSASTDGGAGLLQALGARLLDADGCELGPGGAALARLARLEIAGVSANLAGTEVVVASDVDNPLTGPSGAAAVYGPQKGAAPEQVRLLDAALTRWADVVERTTGSSCREAPGAGAAGGVGFAALAVLGATLAPGIGLMLDLLEVDRHLEGVSLVVVGEGSLDEQSLRGKAPIGMAQAARRAGARVVAVCGRSALSDAQLAAAGIERSYSLTDLEPDPGACMREAAALLERTGELVADDV